MVQGLGVRAISISIMVFPLQFMLPGFEFRDFVENFHRWGVSCSVSELGCGVRSG